MNTLARLFRDFRTEFAVNARLRAGVWLIATVVLFYLALVQSDRVTAAYEEFAAEAGRLARAEGLLEREDWPQLLDAEQATNQALEAAFWQAETQGLAQARLQAALAGIAGRLELRDVRIQPGLIQPVPDVPGSMAGSGAVQRQLRLRCAAPGSVRAGYPSEQTGCRAARHVARQSAAGRDSLGLLRGPRYRTGIGVTAWRPLLKT